MLPCGVAGLELLDNLKRCQAGLVEVSTCVELETRVRFLLRVTAAYAHKRAQGHASDNDLANARDLVLAVDQLALSIGTHGLPVNAPIRKIYGQVQTFIIRLQADLLNLTTDPRFWALLEQTCNQIISMTFVRTPAAEPVWHETPCSDMCQQIISAHGQDFYPRAMYM